jgi:hypothetical protein
MRRTVLVVMVAVLLTSCAWARPRFDAANSGHNPLELAIFRENVSTLREAFRVSSPDRTTPPAFVVARGHLYVEGAPSLVFDAGGGPDCSGSPRTCPPQWTITQHQLPDVMESTLYLGAAYDADGVRGCSGSPKVCAPLWLDDGSGIPTGPVDPTKLHFALGGYTFRGAEQIYLEGNAIELSSRCTEPMLPTFPTPICSTAWQRELGSGPNGGRVGWPAVADGRIFASYSGVGAPRGTLHAFDGRDAAGPRLWSALLPGQGGPSVAVAEGVVVTAAQNAFGWMLAAFDAAGVTNCSGSPKVCTPLWVSDVWTGAGGDSAPAIANGIVYRAAGSQLRAYDLHGTQSCSGSPVVCDPLWQAEVGPGVTAPAVANGVVYTSATDGSVQAYDARGITGCSATTRVCGPLWDTNIGSAAGPVAVSVGRVYVAAVAGTVRVFGLP